MQKKRGCFRASLGSLSEAATVFAPERLQEIIGELAGQLEPLAPDKRLNDIGLVITLGDGSLIAALSRIIKASFRKATTDSGMVKCEIPLAAQPFRSNKSCGAGLHNKQVEIP